MKKRIFACLLVVCMVVAMVPAMAFAAYNDTTGHWAEDAIATWTENGVLDGNGDGTFNPNGTMTRAEAAALFAKLLKLEGAADISKFTDVDADAWYAEAIAKCVAAGIMNGVGADAMDPNGTLTREQMFVMFARALNIEPVASTDKEFNDANEVSDWAAGYVNALVEAGFVKGTADGELEPTLEINRASVVALLDQTIEVYADEDGEKVEATGTGIVLVVANKVEVKAPAGSLVATAPKVEEVKANDVVLKADELHEVPAAPVTPAPAPVVPDVPGNDPTTSEGKDDTTTSEGKYDTTTSEGKDDTTTSEGKGDTTTSEGKGDTTTSEGKGDTTTSEGKGDTTTSEGKGDTTTSEGKGDTTTSEGKGFTDSTEA